MDSSRIYNQTLNSVQENPGPLRIESDVSDIVILNKYSSVQPKSHKIRLNSNVNSNTCSPMRRFGPPHKSNEIMDKCPNDSYHDQPDIILKEELINELEGITEGIQIERMNCPFTDFRDGNVNVNMRCDNHEDKVIKQEIVNDHVEGIGKGCRIEQINCGFTDIKEEIVDTNMRREVQPTEQENETIMDSSRLDNELSKMCSTNRRDSHESPEKRDISRNTENAVAPTKFDTMASNKLVKKCSSAASKSYHIIFKNTNNTAAGPSRFDSEVLNDFIASVKWLVEPERTENNKNDSFHKKQNLTTEQEKDDQIEGIKIFPPIEQTNLSLTNVSNETNNLNKRRGSLLEEAEIKKEKMDDEVFVNEEYQTQNQIFIKDEVPEEVKIATEYCNDTSEHSSFHKRSDREIMKVWRNIEKDNVNRRPRNNEERFWCSNKICLLCDMYIQGTIKEHLTEYHMEGIFFSCPYCDGAKKASMYTLHLELRNHRNDFLLSCNLCVEQLHSWMDLNAHMNQKHNVKMNTTCSLCDFKADSYRTYLDLIDHIFGSHNGRTLVHNCQHCTFATLNISRLQFHIEMKHSVKDFLTLSPPPVANKKTRKTKNYKKMLRKCPLCDFKAESRSLFRAHMQKEHTD